MRQVCRRFRWTHNHKGASRSNMRMLSTGLAGGRVLRRPRYSLSDSDLHIIETEATPTLTFAPF